MRMGVGINLGLSQVARRTRRTRTRTNKLTALNSNPVDFSGLTTQAATGGTVFSVVDDAAELAAAGLTALVTSGKVYKVDNSAGTAVALVASTTTTGNANVHTPSTYIRGTGQAAVRLTGAAVALQNVGASYARVANPLTPSDGNNNFRINIGAGAVIYFILMQLEEAPQASAVIVNTTAGPTSVTEYI